MDDKSKKNRFLESGPVLFQVYQNESMINSRLQFLAPYSYKTEQLVELQNCFNLSFAVLGLVYVDHSNPFNFCVNRGFPTPWDEVAYYINGALKTCGLRQGVYFLEGNTAEFIKRIFSELNPNYSTLFFYTLPDLTGHAVLLHKDKNENVSLIDPQMIDTFGRYPLTIKGEKQIWKYLNVKAIYGRVALTHAVINKSQSIINLCQILKPQAAPLHVNDEPMEPPFTMNDVPMTMLPNTNDDDLMEGLPEANNDPMEGRPANAGAGKPYRGGKKQTRKTRKNKK